MSVDPTDTAPDASTPTGPDDDALFRRLKRWVQQGQDHMADWRKDADEWDAFYAGDQWTDAERAIFEADGRVAPVFNLAAINVDAVCGLEVNNRQNVQYLPRTPGDVKVNQLLSSAAMWVRDQAQSEDEESDAFKDAVITGYGVTETRKADPETISVDRRDMRECFHDPHAKKPNLVDRRYGGRVVMLDTDEAESMFPGFDPVALNAKWAMLGVKDGKENTEKLDYPAGGVDSTGPDLQRPKRVCMVEIEWFDWEGGRKVWSQAFLGASGVIERNPLEAWAYNFITGKRDKKRNTFYGIMKALRDPQKMINKFLATLTHILATNAKGGMLVEEGVFTDPAAAERDWSNPQKNVTVATGALAAGRIQPRTAPPLPAGAIQLVEFALGNIRNVSGINVELLGAADRDQPASLELQRRQSAVTILASLFDSKRRYHKEQGRTLLALMRTLPPETIVRVTVDTSDPEQILAMIPPGTPPEQVQAAMSQMQAAEEQERFVQFALVARALADPSIRYDVIVDEAPSSPNQQQEIIAKLATLASQGMQIPPEGQAIILRNIGLPSTVADELAQAVSGQQQSPEMMELTQALQRAQQEAQQARAELDGVKMDRSLESEKVRVDRFKADTDRIKVVGEQAERSGGVALGPVIAGLEQKTNQIGEAVIAMQGG